MSIEPERISNFDLLTITNAYESGFGHGVQRRPQALPGVREMSHIKTLRRHQAWRMGGDGGMLDPKDLTAAINGLIADHEALQDKYRTEQSLHAATERHNAKLVDENAELMRLYQLAVKERVEACRRADGLESELLANKASNLLKELL